MARLENRAVYVAIGITLHSSKYKSLARVTASDPALLRILSKSEQYKARYDAAKPSVPHVQAV